MGEALRIAQAFVAARREARGLPDYPGTAPETLAQAYAIQRNAIALWGEPVAGWKVGRINAPLDTILGANRLAGPIFPSAIVDASPAPVMPVFAEGFAAAEAEFLLRVGTAPDPAKTHYTLDEAAALIDAVHVGFEIASSPYPGINTGGPTVTVSDFGNNFGLVVGPEVAGWRDQSFLQWPISLSIDGVEAGNAKAADMLDGPFGAAAFLFALAATQELDLRPGQWISSGAVTGVHEIRVGQSSVARFGSDYEIACSISAATA
ncbi:2-keto-4-pentenoate hydratase [Sphingomonas sp. AOB5]|uniref:2-keto-4-pentenoate hydratase n=1 Tax=Sphingomonas sp. AOB5 TaxID=3034017 RepID=UPI0023F9F5B4|nr:2-keto-4-pentenoate hydratase [Sphingomonas sp. AOB5]MDF7777373.1 2-keto-4-pentenoate hydratase [Sphingomonas sp. AOB5]